MSDLIVAKVRRPHGIAGEVAVAVETDRPRHVFRKGRELHLGDARGEPVGRTVILNRMRPTPTGAILRLEGFTTREDAEALRSLVFLIPAAEAAPADADEVRYRDLVGLTVLDAGVEIGKVVDLMQIEPTELLVVRGVNRKEVLVPFVKEFLEGVDLEAGVVRLKLPGGLLDL